MEDFIISQEFGEAEERWGTSLVSKPTEQPLRPDRAKLDGGLMRTRLKSVLIKKKRRNGG